MPSGFSPVVNHALRSSGWGVDCCLVGVFALPLLLFLFLKMFNAGVGPPSAAFFFLLRAENQQYSRSRAHGGGYLDEGGGERAWEGPDTR